MKTPEEIKKGLECCQTIVRCSICPYHDIGDIVAECTAQLSGDALDYIQRLESTVSQVRKALCGKENATLDKILQAVGQLKSRLSQVERERNAMVSTLSDAAYCADCMYHEEDQRKEPCRSCLDSKRRKPH